MYNNIKGVVENPLKCQSSKKLICGSAATIQYDCEAYGCCFNDGKCYHDDRSLSGFVRLQRSAKFATFYDIFTSKTAIECSNLCLSNSNCKCFEYDYNGHICKLSEEVCQPDGDTNGIFSYERIGYREMTCFSTNCNYIAEHNIDNILDCSSTCKTENCKIFTFRIDKQANKCMTHDIYSCDLYDQAFRNQINYVTCFNGPISKIEYKQEDIYIQNIKDDSVQTCNDVTTDKEFNLRVPWPTVDTDSFSFNVEIYGQNLQKCHNSQFALPEEGVVSYFSLDYQPDPSFFGNFHACKYLDGDNVNFCKFNCNCLTSHCTAVHLKVFGLTESNIQICHFNITSI